MTTTAIEQQQFHDSTMLPCGDSFASTSKGFLPLKSALKALQHIAAIKNSWKETNDICKKRVWKWDNDSLVLLGGDVFTIGYLGFQALGSIPRFLKLPGFALASTICGAIGGGINIAVGVVTLKEAFQAFKEDKKLFFRLLFDGVLSIALGVLMILISITAIGVTGFFLSHPWILPLAFLVSYAPCIYEVIRFFINYYAPQNYLSLIRKELVTNKSAKEHRDEIWNILNRDKNLQKFVLKEDPKVEKKFLKKEKAEKKQGVEFSSEELDLIWSHRLMEKLQNDTGSEAAISLVNFLSKDSPNDDDIQSVQEAFKKWEKILWIRMTQQILNAILGIVGFLIFCPNVNQNNLNLSLNAAMIFPNALATYVDIWKPYGRNVTMVVPSAVEITKKSEKNRIAEQRQKIKEVLQQLKKTAQCEEKEAAKTKLKEYAKEIKKIKASSFNKEKICSIEKQTLDNLAQILGKLQPDPDAFRKFIMKKFARVAQLIQKQVEFFDALVFESKKVHQFPY